MLDEMRFKVYAGLLSEIRVLRLRLWSFGKYVWAGGQVGRCMFRWVRVGVSIDGAVAFAIRWEWKVYFMDKVR